MEFSRAQTDFASSKKNDVQETPEDILPWKRGEQVEERLKEQILRLSLDEQNFLRPPPPTSSWFQWSPEKANQQMPIAMTLLREDSNLAAMRFKLVPRKYVNVSSLVILNNFEIVSRAPHQCRLAY